MNAQRKRALTASLLLILASLAGCLGNDLEEIVGDGENNEAIETGLVLSLIHI